MLGNEKDRNDGLIYDRRNSIVLSATDSWHEAQLNSEQSSVRRKETQVLYNISTHSTQMPIQQSGGCFHAMTVQPCAYGIAATRSYFACSQSTEWT